MAYTGQRFPFQAQAGGQGGLMSEPLSGIVSGFTLSPGTVDHANARCHLKVAPGEAILDGQRCRLNAELTLNNFLTGLNIPAADGDADTASFYVVYLTPARKIKAGTANPSGGSQGDRYIKVEEFTDPVLGACQRFVSLHERGASTWSQVPDGGLYLPPGKGWNQSPFTDLAKTTIDADFFSLAPEKTILVDSPGPATMPDRGMVPVRKGASVPIAKFKVRVNRSGSTYTASLIELAYYTEFEKII